MRLPASFQTSIDSVAKAIALTDVGDLQGLVALQELLLELAVEAENAQLTAVCEVTRQAADLVERMVFREVEDTSAAMKQLAEAVEFAQRNQLVPDDGVGTPAIPPGNVSAGPPGTIGAWLTAHASISLQLASLLQRSDASTSPDVAREAAELCSALAAASDASGLNECAAICRSVAGTIDAARDANRPLPEQSIKTSLDWLAEVRRSLDIDDAPPASSAVSPAFAAAIDPPVNDNAPDDNEPVIIAAGEDCQDTLAEFLAEAREHLTGAEAAALLLEKSPHDLEQINTVFRAFHTIKGVAGFMALSQIVDVAHVAETLLDKARSGTYTIDHIGLDLILASCDMLGRMVGQLQGGEPPVKGEVRRLIARLVAAAEGRSVPLPTRTVALSAAIAATTKALTISATGAPNSAAETDPPEPDCGLAADPAPAKATVRRTDQTVKVSTMRMDTLLNMVGELVIAQLMVQQDPLISHLTDQRLQRNLGQMSKIVRDLQEVAMSLRMVTLKGTFQKMTRLVRDMQTRANKQIELVIEGEDTELDRNVVEEIADPLVHMVRNACDHGIEGEADRRKAGKSPTGTLTLRAFHRGGMIVIEVSDDGRGLSRERILKKCIERGLIAADRHPDEIPDAEVYNFVFLPGFSTAEAVTDISGRGVGMDVVKRNIEALRGKIEIRSTPGKGSTFSMQLPLTMAIIDGMLVRVGGHRYVIPTLAIERAFRPMPEHVHSILGKGEVAMVRGDLLPIRRLNRVFQLNEGTDQICEGLLVVLESGGSRCCLLVDEILGQQQVVIKTLGQDGYRLAGVTGGAILGDGRVALIVDVGGLMQQAVAA
ncbi:MAG: chemotaxis protein CheA [Phycisphaerae bacterium]|nr:chemotaxis protein CheA [Phycisphaerae bacterium]